MPPPVKAPRRTHRASDKVSGAAGPAREMDRRPVDGCDLGMESALLEPETVRPKGVRCHQIAADGQIGPVDPLDHPWPGEIPELGGLVWPEPFVDQHRPDGSVGVEQPKGEALGEPSPSSRRVTSTRRPPSGYPTCV